jgi:hypothetical protein
MTDAISRTSQLVGLLREQLAKSSGNGPRARTSQQRQEISDVQVSELIATRVSKISRDDPDRGRKAFRVFVEGVLIGHFGDYIARDPKFHQLVNDVQTQMESSPAIAPMVEKAIAHLLPKQPNGS